MVLTTSDIAPAEVPSRASSESPEARARSSPHPEPSTPERRDSGQPILVLDGSESMTAVPEASPDRTNVAAPSAGVVPAHVAAVPVGGESMAPVGMALSGSIRIKS